MMVNRGANNYEIWRFPVFQYCDKRIQDRNPSVPQFIPISGPFRIGFDNSL
jgi:hypothetical protein